MISSTLLFLVFILAAYISGSIPSGVVIAKSAKGIDPRYAGSNNPGTTNVARLCGFKYGVMTLIADILKGFLPVYIATFFFYSPTLLSIIAVVAIIGHLKSVFLNFDGGKGVATLIGALLPLIFCPLLASALLCLLVAWRSEYVSLGALSLASSLPIFTLIMGDILYIPLTLVILLIIFWTHRANIIRLARNEEKVWRKKKFDESNKDIIDVENTDK